MNDVHTSLKTAVVMRLAQFEKDYLHIVPSAFASAVSDEVIRKVWWSFHEEFNKRSVFNLDPEDRQERYARAWVCGRSSSLFSP